MDYLHYLFVFSLLFTAICAQYQVTVINNVATCPGGNYPTISLFPTDGQKILHQGTAFVILIFMQYYCSNSKRKFYFRHILNASFHEVRA
jgi:hypothetical protein